MVDETRLLSEDISQLPGMKHPRRRVIKGVICGITFALLYFFIGTRFPMRGLKLDMNATERLIFTLQCESSLLPILFAMIATVGNKRFCNPECMNPSVQRDSQSIMVHTRVLSNTMEQFVLHFVAMLAYATFIEPKDIQAVPILCDIFAIGRIVFWIGYALDPTGLWRAPGFAMTVFPTALLIVYDFLKVMGLSWRML